MFNVIFDNIFLNVKKTCTKALNVNKVVANFKWGADKFTLLHLYLNLVRSKLECSFIVYGSARISYLKTLDAKHHQNIRVCLGAFRTSPVDSL